MVLSNYTEKIERPVRAIYLDDERTFWVGTKGNGILKIYDYEFDKNISDCRAEVLTTSNSALSSNAVYCFAKSHRNLLWIGDEEGLTYYSYRENVSRVYQYGSVTKILNTSMAFTKQQIPNCGWRVSAWEW